MDRKLTIIIDVNTSGGAERVAAILANYFVNNGYCVNIINSDKDSAFYHLDNKINVIKMGLDYSKKGMIYSAIRLVKKYLYLRKYFRKHRNETILTFLTRMEMPVIVAARSYKGQIYTSVRNDPQRYTLPVRMFRRITYPCIAGVVFQTKTVSSFKDFKKIRKSAVIANPLMQAINEKQIPIPHSQRKRKICNVARLEKQKNQECLIRAFAKIAADYPDITLSIYGEGPLRKTLQKLIEELGMCSRIMLPGVEKNVVCHNKDALMFVLSSYYEGMPNALMEAMAYGIPSISTDFASGAARELIRDGVNGFLFPVDNVEALEKKMRYVLDNPDIADRAALEATKIYDSYNVETICAKWEKFLFSEERLNAKEREE